MTCPTLISTGVAAAVQIDWPAARTVTRTLSDLPPALATTYVPAPRRTTRTNPVASTVTSVGSRETNVGAGVALLPKASRLFADTRTESTLTSKRGFCGVIETFVMGPATPVAVNLIDVTTPSTLAVTSFCPMIVPSDQAAVACPLASVTATRGMVTPLPSVTASATVAPTTG
jgi:hypothetical protein